MWRLDHEHILSKKGASHSLAFEAALALARPLYIKQEILVVNRMAAAEIPVWLRIVGATDEEITLSLEWIRDCLPSGNPARLEQNSSHAQSGLDCVKRACSPSGVLRATASDAVLRLYEAPKLDQAPNVMEPLCPGLEPIELVRCRDAADAGDMFTRGCISMTSPTRFDTHLHLNNDALEVRKSRYFGSLICVTETIDMNDSIRIATSPVDFMGMAPTHVDVPMAFIRRIRKDRKIYYADHYPNCMIAGDILQMLKSEVDSVSLVQAPFGSLMDLAERGKVVYSNVPVQQIAGQSHPSLMSIKNGPAVHHVLPFVQMTMRWATAGLFDRLDIDDYGMPVILG